MRWRLDERRDELAVAARTPDAPIITGAEGEPLAEDWRAAHTFWRENGLDYAAGVPLAAGCDDDCRAMSCMFPASWGSSEQEPRDRLVERPEVMDWLRQFSRPVIVAPGGDLLEVAAEATVTSVVDAMLSL